VGGFVLVGVVAVGGLVGAVGAVGTVEGVLDRIAGLLPGEARGAARGFPAATHLGFQMVVPAPAAGLLAHFQAVAVGRGIVAVVVEVRVGIGTVGVLDAPVLGLA